MQPGQTFGPFTLEKKIGAGAMGAVWRAIYTKTGQRVAIKIMLPGLTEENANAAARFDREVAILKQLDHPNIVRLFGVGKYQGNRYYAMEFIEGESLDRIMSRRDRMSWEEVVALGKQLCAALQHAHEHGVIHRDLKPSNLMILKDGTLKLTDFGIAKDVDVTQLTEANCTVGTASYMSPEQCRGERNLTSKSDLYSLGIVFYELLTGDKPFKADNAMEMFLQHVNGKFVRPGKRVLELPVWFDTLICQLMEKKPEQRPLDAVMVGNVLNTISEKVQALQSAGVDAATRRRGDRSRGVQERSEEDREIARALAGKPKRKMPKTYFYQRWWFVAASVLLVLSIMATVLFLAVWLWPRSSSVEKLYARAKVLMVESKNPDEDWAKAIDAETGGPLYQFELYHKDDKGEQADQMRQWWTAAWKRECDKMVRQYLRNRKKNLPYEAHGDAQENAFAAGLAEEEGDLKTAQERWKKVKDSAAGESASWARAWAGLAEDRLQQIAEIDTTERGLVKYLEALRDPNYNPSLSEPQLELAKGLRYQRFGDRWRAYQEFETLREKYGKDPDLRFWYVFATKKAKELKPKINDTDDKADRRERITERRMEAENLADAGDVLNARLRFLHIIALYGDDMDEEIQKNVKAANQWLKERGYK